MKLIVGLGNPGKEYETTRHNVGFMCVDNYLKNNNLKTKEKFNGEYAEATINNEKVILLKPLSFMNNSGTIVKKYAEYFKINVEDILIIYDDMDFELGTYKLKPFGSCGGHNGIRNIIDNFKTENIKRLRIGISRTNNDKIDYVIGNFSKKELEIINFTIIKTEDIIKDFANLDYENLMSKYN